MTKRLPYWALFLAAPLLLAAPAEATLHNLAFTATIVSRDVGLNFAVGDRFDIALTLDDTVTDTDAAVGGGRFPSLLTAFSMTADPANLGSWVPSGTFEFPSSNFVTNAFGDGFTFQLGGFGFPSGDALGLPFHGRGHQLRLGRRHHGLRPR